MKKVENNKKIGKLIKNSLITIEWMHVPSSGMYIVYNNDDSEFPFHKPNIPTPADYLASLFYENFVIL